MITTNVYQRVFKIKYASSIGTCFTIEVDSKQYLITARHVVDGFSGTSLDIFHNNQWKTIPVCLVDHCSGEVDISVFAASIQLSPTYELPPTCAGMCYGQDMYFLGFPFGMQFDAGNINRDFPLPFVKKCILSAQGSHKSLLYLDGHNNLGFSGGPVVFEVPGKIRTQIKGEIIEVDYKVAAVISGYRHDPKDVVHNGNPTGLIMNENSGLILAYSIQEAVDVIRANPIGFEIKSRPAVSADTVQRTAFMPEVKIPCQLPRNDGSENKLLN